MKESTAGVEKVWGPKERHELAENQNQSNYTCYQNMAWILDLRTLSWVFLQKFGMKLNLFLTSLEQLECSQTNSQWKSKRGSVRQCFINIFEINNLWNE